MNIVLPLAGAVLVVVALVDVFLVVLYARSGGGLLTPHLNHGLWKLFKAIAPNQGSLRDTILSFAGPVMMVTTIGVWVLLLLFGFALVVWPGLGGSITASIGPTPTGFAAALYYSGYSLTTLGTGDIVPQTSGYRLLMVAQATIGFSVLTLTITYLMSVYSALVRRNRLGQTLHHLSGGTGDAAELVSGLGAGGDFQEARSTLTTLGSAVLDLLESHHSYPVLHYFRLPKPHYAMARIALLTMDSASLIRAGVGAPHQSLVRSGQLELLWGSGQALLAETASTFLPKDADKREDARRDRQQEISRFEAAMTRLDTAGISVSTQTGRDREYLKLRDQWVGLTRAFAKSMAYSWNEIEVPRDSSEHRSSGASSQ